MGCFARTPPAAHRRPFVIGIALQAARLVTIFSQTCDIVMDAIVTEEGPQ